MRDWRAPWRHSAPQPDAQFQRVVAGLALFLVFLLFVVFVL
jgi:hypothetical protein